MTLYPPETRQPVVCGSCGWTGKRLTGEIVMCPKCGRPAAFQWVAETANHDRKEGG